MCGIIGIASNKPVSMNIINSLKRLEYRGYDSAGLATLKNNEINEKKCSARVEQLESKSVKEQVNGTKAESDSGSRNRFGGRVHRKRNDNRTQKSP